MSWSGRIIEQRQVHTPRPLQCWAGQQLRARRGGREL